jgi:hypothetical protein
MVREISILGVEEYKTESQTSNAIIPGTRSV